MADNLLQFDVLKSKIGPILAQLSTDSLTHMFCAKITSCRVWLMCSNYEDMWLRDLRYCVCSLALPFGVDCDWMYAVE